MRTRSRYMTGFQENYVKVEMTRKGKQIEGKFAVSIENEGTKVYQHGMILRSGQQGLASVAAESLTG